MLLDDVLIIFVRYPQPGMVKTRLAKEIGNKKAALLHRLFVEAILMRTNDTDFARFVFYYPPEKREAIRNWLGQDLVIYPQEGDTLGERLSNAFKFTFKKGAKKVVAIGTDSPTIDRKVIKDAFRLLKNMKCVLGPALDGGYYLIGLSSFLEGLFKRISWGTGRVLEQTRDRLKRLSANYSLLDKSFDVDSYRDIFLLKYGLQNALKKNPVGLGPIISVLDEITPY